jgi:hypothetical protein
MPSRKELKGVIRGFLGTYVSRYSDFNGALLFGDVVEHLTVEEIDLTESAPTPPSATAENALIGLSRLKFQEGMTPENALTALARRKFQEQLSKVGLPPSVVRNATLTIRKCDLNSTCGSDVLFNVRVETDLGRVYEDGVREFIYPNKPRLAGGSPEQRRSSLASVLRGVFDWLRLR